MTRAISIGWPDLIGKCRSIFLRYSHWSLTGHFGIMESTPSNRAVFIYLVLHLHPIGLENSRHFLIQSVQNDWLNLGLRLQSSNIERFSFECQKYLVLHSLRHSIGLENSCHFFSQSGVKPKPSMTHSHMFSHTLDQLHIITWSFDWVTGLSPSFVIGLSDNFGFGFL